MSVIVPSLPATSFDEIEALANALRGVLPELQIDIVDGKFVEAHSWPFTEENPRAALEHLRSVTNSFAIEMDCMVVAPESYLDMFVELGVRRVIVHIGSTENYDACFAHARRHGYKIGIAFTNDVPMETYKMYISQVDFVQIMGIAVVGKQGQPFDERTLETARALRAAYPDLEIAVDGSVNEHTIEALQAAGVNRFAPGSAIAKQTDPVAAYHHLMDLIS